MGEAPGTSVGPLGFALLNDWQRDFPLVSEPYAELAGALGCQPGQVTETLAYLQQAGHVSRVGGVWASGAGGAGMLCALAVPRQRLDAVAADVSAQPWVNHNYEREHAWNLWFVVTAADRDALHAGVDALEARHGLQALRLPMRRAYRIDLGFDMRRRLAPGGEPSLGRPVPVAAADRGLAALLEKGLPLLPRPFAAWGQACARDEHEVLATVRRWLEQGTLRRFGVIVRHHELGFGDNAMTVFDVPDDQVDAAGDALARQHGVTLAYRRERAPGWPYNLYCMVHGRSRPEVMAAIEAGASAAGLLPWPRETLFSRRRFKQTGSRYFATSLDPRVADPEPTRNAA